MGRSVRAGDVNVNRSCLGDKHWPKRDVSCPFIPNRVFINSKLTKNGDI